MECIAVTPPRKYLVGPNNDIEISDCARLKLEADEQVTFITPAGAEYDLTRKNWGFYATPSLNGRLLQFGLHAVVVKNRDGKFYIFLVEKMHEASFNHYIENEGYKIICWMDSNEALNELEQIMERLT